MIKISKAFKIIPIFIFSLLISCGDQIQFHKLSVDKGKKFDRLNFKKIWEIDFPFANACFPCPNGILFIEIMDRGWSEFKLHLYDYSGELKKQRILKSGQGPNEIQALNYNTAWISSSGKINFIDIGDYHKILDPETFEIETVSKLSNVIKGYGYKYTFGRISSTSLENNGKYVITSFESTAFPENFTYFIGKSSDTFDNLSIITIARKVEPWTWVKLNKREAYTDYYGKIRLYRILSVDWKREIIYFLQDIEVPEIESVSFDGRQKRKYFIDINFKKYEIDRKEFEFYHEYVIGETAPIIRKYFNQILYMPPHAPPIMSLKVIEDWLIIITGKRNWNRGENEAQVFKLPSFEYKGSFYIPFSNLLMIKWIDDYYITKDLINKKDECHSSFKIYKIEKN